MKIVVLTDVHANLPALDVALNVITREGYDLLVHVGDAIAIGPYPAECLDRLLNLPRAQFVMGNHDDWFANGLPQPQPVWMSDGEVVHQHWTHAQIAPALRVVLAKWPFVLQHVIDSIKLTFLHYALEADGRNFIPPLRSPDPAGLDRLFANLAGTGGILVYGHTHDFLDMQGRAHYLNPGSLGCYEHALARYSVINVKQENFAITHRQVVYDDAELFKAFEQRQVPEREFICKAFFGGRK